MLPVDSRHTGRSDNTTHHSPAHHMPTREKEHSVPKTKSLDESGKSTTTRVVGTFSCTSIGVKQYSGETIV